MPNWCVNDLEVAGEEPDIVEFKKTVAGVYEDGKKCAFDFNSIIPYPKEYNDLDTAREKDPKDYSVRDGYNQGGYEWCLTNWGVKWNASSLKFEDEGYVLYYSFDTPWDAPRPVIRKLIHDWPKLRFNLRYRECGMGFQGVLSGWNGGIAEDWCGDYRGGQGG